MTTCASVGDGRYYEKDGKKLCTLSCSAVGLVDVGAAKCSESCSGYYQIVQGEKQCASSCDFLDESDPWRCADSCQFLQYNEDHKKYQCSRNCTSLGLAVIGKHQNI